MVLYEPSWNSFEIEMTYLMKKMEMGCKNRDKLIDFGLIFYPDCEHFSIFLRFDTNRIEDVSTERE